MTKFPGVFPFFILACKAGLYFGQTNFEQLLPGLSKLGKKLEEKTEKPENSRDCDVMSQ